MYCSTSIRIHTLQEQPVSVVVVSQYLARNSINIFSHDQTESNYPSFSVALHPYHPWDHLEVLKWGYHLGHHRQGLKSFIQLVLTVAWEVMNSMMEVVTIRAVHQMTMIVLLYQLSLQLVVIVMLVSTIKLSSLCSLIIHQLLLWSVMYQWKQVMSYSALTSFSTEKFAVNVLLESSSSHKDNDCNPSLPVTAGITTCIWAIGKLPLFGKQTLPTNH